VRPNFRASKKLPASLRLKVAGLVGRQGLRLSTQKKTGNASATEGIGKGRAATFRSEANVSLMMRHGRACLLLWGRRYSGGDADYPLLYVYIQVNVITMLLGDVGHEAGGTSPATGDKWPCVKSDFCSAVLRGVVSEHQ